MIRGNPFIHFAHFKPKRPSRGRVSFVVVKDPRVDTKWQGSGEPTAEWLEHRARRTRRAGPYRANTGLPLGLRLALIQGLRTSSRTCRRTAALCLDKLAHIAIDYGFRTAGDLYHRSV